MKADPSQNFVEYLIGYAKEVGRHPWIIRVNLPSPKSFSGRITSEGLAVAAWVSLWEALANFLIQCPPHNREIRLYKHLADASVTFQELS
jgi:hypothetical protein